MNEEYIRGFQKSPDPRLISRIEARLEKRERTQWIKRYSLLSALVLTFMFGMLMMFSSSVRADVIRIFMKIGGVQYHVSSEKPFNPYIPSIELEAEYLPWAEARTRFLSPLQLPTYIPQGYEQEVDTSFSVWGNGDPMLRVIWRKEGQFALIGLWINQCTEDAQGCGMGMGPGGLEEITLNGKPGTLVRGAWNEETRQYDLSDTISLVWRYDENTVYQLSSADQSLVDELIKMAESVP
jgi:hypothetical protein